MSKQPDKTKKTKKTKDSENTKTIVQTTKDEASRSHDLDHAGPAPDRSLRRKATRPNSPGCRANWWRCSSGSSRQVRRSASSSRAATPPARAGSSNESRNASAPEPSAWSPCRPRPIAIALGFDKPLSGVIGGRRQLMLFGLSFLMILLASELGVLQRILDTTPLTGGPWLVCLAAAVALIAIDEGIKWALRSRRRVP